MTLDDTKSKSIKVGRAFTHIYIHYLKSNKQNIFLLFKFNVVRVYLTFLKLEIIEMRVSNIFASIVDATTNYINRDKNF